MPPLKLSDAEKATLDTLAVLAFAARVVPAIADALARIRDHHGTARHVTDILPTPLESEVTANELERGG